jgi:putative oxidoreductase
MILRRIARPMLAAVFVTSGLDTLRNPGPAVDTAAPAIDKAVEQVKDKVPAQVPTDPELLVKVNAVAQVGAGIALALGKFPRLSALVLAASLAPTTAAAHRFWEHEDSMDRTAQRIHFLKNVGLLGGLLIAAADTHGKPSLSWRAKHATDAAVHGAAASVQEAAKSAQGSVKDVAKSAQGSVKDIAKTTQGSVKDITKSARGTAKDVARSARGNVTGVARSVETTAKSLAKVV